MQTVTIPLPGYEIIGDFYEGTSDEVLLVLIGFTSNRTKYSEMIEPIIAGTNSSALVIDYSGHGDSPFDINDMSTAENFNEVIAAYDWIEKNRPGKTINVLGTSYGGFHAALLTQYRSVKKLILRVPAIYEVQSFYTKWRDMDREKLRTVYRTDADNFIAHPVLAHAKQFKGKKLVITHELDDVCPPATTSLFTDSFNADAWEAKGFMHGLGQSTYTEDQIKEYRQIIIDWLNKN